MTPAAIIQQTRADGVRLALSISGTIKATGEQAAVNRWLSVIREHKAGIADALKFNHADMATASRWWLIHYPDREPVQVACFPDATFAEVMERRPDAIAAEPIQPEPVHGVESDRKE